MTRGEIIHTFHALSEEMNAAVERGNVTPEEARNAIDRYRERADVLLGALKQEKELAHEH